MFATSGATLAADVSPAFTFFAQCGDLDQIYDPAVGSPDRKSSYTGKWCELESPDGKQAWDTDIPAADVLAKVEFRLSGYPAFDPDSVEYALLRFDVLYEPVSGPDRGYGDESISLANNETCEGICTFNYTKRLRSALVAAGRDERQWISLTLDLISGVADATEIDGRGNPILGRFYPNVGVDPCDEKTKRYLADACRKILRAASDGSIQGSWQWSGRASYVSFLGRGRKPSTNKVLPVRSVENQVGTTMLGGPNELRDADATNWKIRAQSNADSWVAGFVAVFDVPEVIQTADKTAQFDAIVEMNGGMQGSAPGRYVLSVINPEKSAPDNEVVISDGTFSTSANKQTKLRRELKDIRTYVDQQGKLRIKFSYSNMLKSIPLTNVLEKFNTGIVPTVQLDRLRVIVRVPE